jgi:hypothetical protein
MGLDNIDRHPQYRNYGGGNGNPPGDEQMSARVDRLDRVCERIEGDISTLKVDVGSIKTELPHLATKTWILGGVITVLIGIVLACWWAAQQYLGPILQHLGK